MSTVESEWPEVPGLPTEVLERIVTELGGRGPKVIRCLATAAALVAQARADETGLRLAESAAYNLREALDAVVSDQPASDGGLSAALRAWRQYKLAIQEPGADEEAARSDLHDVLERLEQDEERHGFRARQLLAYVRELTGIGPLPGEGDPTSQYNNLREQANDTLHGDGTIAGVAGLYEKVVAWFVRFFTPPDDQVQALIALAEQPYVDGMVEQLRDRLLNSHQLRLFLSRLQDPGWLDPLCEAGLIRLPRDGEPWPVSSLVDAAESVGAARIAEVLDQLLEESRQEPVDRRLVSAREIIECAARLDAAGHSVAERVIGRCPTDRWVQMLAVSIARRAHPADPIQTTVTDAVAGNEPRSSGGYNTRMMLSRLAEGLTTDNMADRSRCWWRRSAVSQTTSGWVSRCSTQLGYPPRATT